MLDCRVTGCAFPDGTKINPHVVIFQRGGAVLFVEPQILVADVLQRIGNLISFRKMLVAAAEIPQRRQRQDRRIKCAV